MTRQRPNIVLISIDTLRFDCPAYQPCTTYLERLEVPKRPFMPTFDRLAGESLCFLDAVSTSTYTTSAHASIMTGLEPPRHGVRAFYKTKLLPSVPTLAEQLGSVGYHCVLATDVSELFAPLDLTRGFHSVTVADDDHLFRELRNSARPIFAFIHLFDVHAPYTWSEEPSWQDNRAYREELTQVAHALGVPVPKGAPRAQWRELLRSLPSGKANPEVFLPLYLRGVETFDHGRFHRITEELERLALLGDDTCTFVFSDHGEGNYSGHLGHGGPLIDEVLRVPLILHAPGVFQARTIGHQVSLTALAPAVLELAGFPPGGTMPAPDVANLIRATESCGSSQPPVAYSEMWFSHRNLDVDDLTSAGLRTVDWTMGERAVRIPGYKLKVRGTPKPVVLESSASDNSDEEFVASAYHTVLGRDPDASGKETFLAALSEGRLARSAVLRSLLESDETALHRFVTYDLAETPFEEFDQPRRAPRISWHDGWLLRELESRGDALDEAPPIFDEEPPDGYTQAQEAVIAERLRNLGYVE
jgi:arylsulfatase